MRGGGGEQEIMSAAHITSAKSLMCLWNTGQGPLNEGTGSSRVLDALLCYIILNHSDTKLVCKNKPVKL